jgi:hypothetical protein
MRAAGDRKENAAASRRRLRKEAAIVREDFILERFAAGDRVDEIAAKVAGRYGSCSRSHLYEVIPRALARRAEALDQHSVEQARALYVERLEMLLSAHMPRALGVPFDPSTMTDAVAPDLRSAVFVLGVVERIAEATGGKERPVRGAVNVNVFNIPDDPERARERVLAELAKETEKLRVVEGHLVAVGSTLGTLTDGHDANDRLPPPGSTIEAE